MAGNLKVNQKLLERRQAAIGHCPAAGTGISFAEGLSHRRKTLDIRRQIERHHVGEQNADRLEESV